MPTPTLPFDLPDRYEFDNSIMSGGQGSVYVCKDKLLKRKVVIKQLHAIDDKVSLIKEIKSRAKIQSKHVVELYDCWYDEDGDPSELVLEHVPGESMQAKSNLPKKKKNKLKILYQLACGLVDIHDANVIHRDIKPGNIKTTSDGVLKIFDLGLSNLDADNADTLMAAGTLGFRAPEFYKTPPIKLTRSVDMYAFGATAWYVFSGTLPSQLLEHPPQSSGPAPRFSDSFKKVHPEVGEAIDLCISSNPKDRPTANYLRNLLNRHLTNGKHRATINHNGTIHEISKTSKITRVKVGSLGTISISYDGLRFIVVACLGDVYLNNAPISVGQVIHDSCVITFGDPELGRVRTFFPINVSKPELVL